MIVGSGLIASAMKARIPDSSSLCIYAAGVSNSSCRDSSEFYREHKRLTETIAALPSTCGLVYFGTCSVSDPCAASTPYVQHKLRMEALVLERGNAKVFRLPQVVGVTLNPHTLTNYLMARIARSEQFTIWKNARRHLIHADDMARIAADLLEKCGNDNQIVNISSPDKYSVFQIVAAIEHLVGKTAHYDVVDKGADFALDTEQAVASAAQLGIDFGPGYLERILERTYGRNGGEARFSSEPSNGTP